jgi:hypothetical protein
MCTKNFIYIYIYYNMSRRSRRSSVPWTIENAYMKDVNELTRECKSQYDMSLFQPSDYIDYINKQNPKDINFFMNRCMADPQNMRGGRKSRRTKRRGTKRTKTRRRRR